jgi:thioesterase domain-containing protein
VVLFVAKEGGHPEEEDRTLGWAELAAGGVEVVTVQGGHFTMLAPPHVEALVRELRRGLNTPDV